MPAPQLRARERTPPRARSCIMIKAGVVVKVSFSANQTEHVTHLATVRCTHKKSPSTNSISGWLKPFVRMDSSGGI
jgi:hypothetical protein